MPGVSRRARAATRLSAGHPIDWRKIRRLRHGRARDRTCGDRAPRHGSKIAAVGNATAGKAPTSGVRDVREAPWSKRHNGHRASDTLRQQGTGAPIRRAIRTERLVRSAGRGPHRLSSTWMAVMRSCGRAREPGTAGQADKDT